MTQMILLCSELITVSMNTWSTNYSSKMIVMLKDRKCVDDGAFWIVGFSQAVVLCTKCKSICRHFLYGPMLC